MKRAEHQPEEVELVLYGGVFMKVWSVRDAGTLLPQHAHQTAHISFISRGSVRAWRGDELLGDYHAPSAVKIAAQELHSFLTMTDNTTICCIHNTDRLDGDEPAVAERAHLELED